MFIQQHTQRLATWLEAHLQADWTKSVLSPSGAAVAFVGSDDEGRALFVIDADSLALTSLVTASQIAAVGANGQHFQALAWSEDGLKMAFSTAQGPPPGKHARLWVVSEAEKPVLLYEAVGLLAGFAFSPDGQQIAVADWGAGLVIIDAAGMQVWQDTSAMRYPLEKNALAWSADSQTLYYNRMAAQNGGLWRWYRDGRVQHVVKLPEDEVLLPAYPVHADAYTWGALRGNSRSPECGVSLFWENSWDHAIKALDAPEFDFDASSALLPGPDGKTWACTVWQSGRSIALIFNLDTGQVIPLAGDDEQVDRLAGWTADGTGLWAWLPSGQLRCLTTVQLDDVSDEVHPSIILGAAEVLVICATLDFPILLDVRLPEFAAAADQKEFAVGARRSLQKRGILNSLADEPWQVDATVAALVGCCAKPETVWSVTTKRDDTQIDCHIYQAQTLIVVDTLLTEGEHQFTPFENLQVALAWLMDDWPLETASQPCSAEIDVHRDVFYRIQTIADVNGAEQAQRYLVGIGMDIGGAQLLAQDLTQPAFIVDMSRRLMTNNRPGAGGEQVRVLIGEQATWLIKPMAGSDKFRITAVGPEVIKNQLWTFLRRV